jgi:CubicO group peptidase (beta-lactamase class C family)
VPWLRELGGLAHVTIRQALNHTTGIVRNGNDADYWQLEQPFPDRDELRRQVEHGGEVLPANESFKYSNIAYALLGLVIEAASGMTYNEYVTQRIITPLGLTDTGPDTDTHTPDRLVTGYTARRFGLPHRPIPDAPTNALAAATGFYSTAEDLSRYAAAHFFGETILLSDASKREMQQPYWRVAQDGSHYGLGLAIQEIDGHRFVGHGGGFPGHATNTLFDPKGRLVVVALTNLVSGPASILSQGILRILRFALRQPPAEPSPIALERFTGRYFNMWGVADVAAFGNSLVAVRPEADDPVKMVDRLAIEDDLTLRVTEASGYGAPGEPMRFSRDATGQVTKVIAGGTSAYPEAIYRARLAGEA